MGGAVCVRGYSTHVMDGGSLAQSIRRVLVLDDATPRRTKTCELVEREGYVTVGVSDVRTAVDALDDDVPTVLVYDVSAPRSWREVTAENTLLRTLVAGRCPVVLYGDRPPVEFSALERAAQSAAHISSDDGGLRLLALLRRLLPPVIDRPTAPVPPFAEFDSELSRVRLLLVDESEYTLEVTQARLSAVGFDVRIAVAIGEVRSIVMHWAPNILVADIKRADLSASDFVAQLKATTPRRDMVVVLSSNLPELELRRLASTAGADAHVSKSEGIETYVASLRALGKRVHHAEPPRSASPRAVVKGP